jgi:hypothetical protein
MRLHAGRRVAAAAVALVLWVSPAFAKTMSKETDTNQDGRTDQVKTFLKGRQLVLTEFDRNFDGKVDRRKLSQWGMKRLVPGEPPIPGYETLFVEEDNNFDGKIDVYREKGNKNASKKIGQPIDVNFHSSSS